MTPQSIKDFDLICLKCRSKNVHILLETSYRTYSLWIECFDCRNKNNIEKYLV